MKVLDLHLDTSTAPQTLDQAMDNARALKPRILEQAAETEARTRHFPEVHLDFVDAGFYHLFRPKTFGGYEFSVPDGLHVMREIASAELSTAWSLCISSTHNLQIASGFGESAQRTVFGEGHFSTPMTTAPGGTIRKVDGGWLLNSRQPYSSGAPYGTHFVGHAFVETDQPGPPGPMSIFMVPHSDWTMLDDWSNTLGLKGSGSNTLSFENTFLPEEFMLEGQTQIDFPTECGTPDTRLHGNPMYDGRGLGIFGIEMVYLVVRAVQGALEEYEKLLTTRYTTRPPIALRSEDSTYQAWYGNAVSGIETTFGMIEKTAHRYMEFCNRAATCGARHYRGTFRNGRIALRLRHATPHYPSVRSHHAEFSPPPRKEALCHARESGGNLPRMRCL